MGRAGSSLVVGNLPQKENDAGGDDHKGCSRRPASKTTRIAGKVSSCKKLLREPEKLPSKPSRWTYFCYRRVVELRQWSSRLSIAKCGNRAGVPKISASLFPTSGLLRCAGNKLYELSCFRPPNWVHCLKLPRRKTRRVRPTAAQAHPDEGATQARLCRCA